MSGERNLPDTTTEDRKLNDNLGTKAEGSLGVADDSQRSINSTPPLPHIKTVGSCETLVNPNDDWFNLPPKPVKPDGSWYAHTNVLPENGPPPKTFETPNKKLSHFFIRHVVDSLEACSHKFASKHFFDGMLDNVMWRFEHFATEPRLKHLEYKSVDTISQSN